jgi:WD40 repeat protein/tRNA A-37 threonylcarbamoyl transferase component Bud32
MASESFDGNTRDRRFQEVLAEYLQALENGTAPDRKELLGRHPELADQLAAYFANRERFDHLAEPLAMAPTGNLAREVEGAGPDLVGRIGHPFYTNDASSALTLAPGEVSAVGTKVRYFGDYELLDEIGRGGMGVVYKARQVNLKRVVALKMILSGQLANSDDVRRFHAEAEAAAKLDHPGIVPVFEVGQHEGHHYFSMGFIEGESLAHQLTAGLPFPRRAAELIKKVAEAVAYAHVEGVVHRDLKPANILIDKTGQPRLTDFGLAKHVERGAESAERQDSSAPRSALNALTQTGQILGTPSYMPPEQASGQRGVVGPLADIYSLGAVLYCLLTGRPPFQAANPLDTLLQVLDCEPAPPRQLNAAVPRDLETICLKCLSKESRKRYASAQDLVADLERFLNGQPIVARPTGMTERVGKWIRRRPTAAALLLVTGMAAIGLPLLLAALLQNAELRAQAVQDLSVATSNLQLARGETAKEQLLAKEAQARLQTAKQEQRAAEKAAELQKGLARETQKKMDAAAEQAKEMQAKAKRHADGLRLIGQSSALRVNNPGLALLLAIEGQERAPGLMANNALREAIDECHEERTIPVGYAWRSVWYTPDGKQIISIPPGGGGSTVRLSDAATGKHIGDLNLPPVTINSASLSPDGKRIVFTFHQHNRMIWYNKPPEIIYTDRVARVWDIALRKEIAILKGHKSRVVSARFSPDGKKLVTASWDGTARVWDTVTWTDECVIAAHEAGATAAIFSPDGRSILTASTSFRNERSPDVELLKVKNALLDPPAGTLPPGVKPGDQPGSSGYSSSGGGRRVEEKNAVAIWNAATGEKRVALKHGPKRMHPALDLDSPFFPLAWSAKGDQVLTWSPAASNGITLWDADTGEARVTLPTGFFSHALFNPDGTRVLTAPHDRGKLSLWDTASGKEALAIRVSAGVNGAPSYSANGRWILCACADKSARIWSADTGEELWCFRGHQVGVASTAFSPDGAHVVTASADGTVRIWNLQRDRDYARVLHGQGMLQVAFSPNGRRLAAASFDPSLWDVETGELRHTLRGLAFLAGSPAREQILGGTVSLEFSADSRRLLVATKEGPARIVKPTLFGFGKNIEQEVPLTPVRLWDVETGKEVRAFRGPRGEVGRAAFSPDGKLVLAAESGSQHVRTFLHTGGQMGSSNGSIRDGQAYVWHADSGKLLQTLKGHEWGITATAWSPDSKRVLTADFSNGSKIDDGAARIWDVESGKPVVNLEGDRGGVRLATFSPDGKHVLMLHHPALYYVEIWDASTGQIALTLGMPTYYKYSREWDAKAKKTVIKRNGRVVYVAAEGETPLGHTGMITHAAYSPDGRHIVTTSEDRTARIWNAVTGEQLFVLRGHILGVQRAAFSADGKRVVTASYDATARVWDAEGGNEIFTLAGHDAVRVTAVFSPDGKYVATGSADASARIWPLDPLPLALSRRPRELTADERERFGIDSAHTR